MFSLSSLKQWIQKWAGGKNPLLFSAVFFLLPTGAGSAGAAQPPKRKQFLLAGSALPEWNKALLTCPGSCFLCIHYFSAVKSKGIVLWMLLAVPGKGRCWWTWKQRNFPWSLVQMFVQCRNPYLKFIIGLKLQWESNEESFLYCMQ